MADFQPAQPPTGLRSGKTTVTPETVAEQRRRQLGYRRHGCDTAVFFTTLLVWVVTLAGLAAATGRWGLYGLLVLAVPLLLSLLRRWIADAIFRFTIRNAGR